MSNHTAPHSFESVERARALLHAILADAEGASERTFPNLRDEIDRICDGVLRTAFAAIEEATSDPAVVRLQSVKGVAQYTVQVGNEWPRPITVAEAAEITKAIESGEVPT